MACDQTRVQLMAEQIATWVLAHMGRTWHWRVTGVAAAMVGLVVTAGSVGGLLANAR